MPIPPPNTPTLTTIAAQSARATSLLDRWLTELESADASPTSFPTNINSLSQATGLLYRLTAIEKTLAALRHRDTRDLRMLQEMNFLFDKIQRLYKNRPLLTPRQSQRATPLPQAPASPPSTPRPPAAASEQSGSGVSPLISPNPFGPQTTLLNFNLSPPPAIATALTENSATTNVVQTFLSGPEPSPCSTAAPGCDLGTPLSPKAPKAVDPAVGDVGVPPQPVPFIPTRTNLLNTIRACRLPSGWCNESLRPQLLSYFCHVLNHFCTRMESRIASRETISPLPQSPSAPPSIPSIPSTASISSPSSVQSSQSVDSDFPP